MIQLENSLFSFYINCDAKRKSANIFPRAAHYGSKWAAVWPSLVQYVSPWLLRVSYLFLCYTEYFGNKKPSSYSIAVLWIALRTVLSKSSVVSIVTITYEAMNCNCTLFGLQLDRWLGSQAFHLERVQFIQYLNRLISFGLLASLLQ